MDEKLKITLRNDYAFKRCFTDEKNKMAMIDFLSCVLDIPINEIEDIQFLDKELTRDNPLNKTGILDLKVLLNLKLKSKKEIGIEIQNVWLDGFDRRLLFYWGKMYTSNLQKNKSYTNLTDCVIISLVGSAFKLNSQLHSTYQLLEKSTHQKLNTAIEIHFLNLAKAKKMEVAENKKDKKILSWLKFIETDDESARRLLSGESQVLKILNETVEYIGQDPVERALYESRMMLKHDIISSNESYYKKGIASAQKEIDEAKAETQEARAETEKVKEENARLKAELEKLKKQGR